MEKNCNWWSTNITRSTRNHLLQIHVGSLTILSLQFGTLKKRCAIKCFSVLSIISIRIYKCVCVCAHQFTIQIYTVESPDKGHFGSYINSAHFVPCRGIVLGRFYLHYFGTGINFGGLQVCLSERDYQYIVPLSECPLSETSLYITCFIVCLTCLSIMYSLIV